MSASDIAAEKTARNLKTGERGIGASAPAPPVPNGHPIQPDALD